MKVLIIKLSSIGDVIHTLPALGALREGLGKKARIDWLVEEAASSVLAGHPLIDNVIVVKRGWARHFMENLRRARMIAAERYDIVIDFQGLLKSGSWAALSRGSRRIGFSNAREMSPLFYNEKLPPFDIERHAVDRYLDLARYAGGRPGEAVFTLKAAGNAKKRAIAKLRDAGITDKDGFFAVIPRARWATKLWADERFVEAAKRISADTGLVPLLIGGTSDVKSLDEMRAAIGGRAVSLAGRTDLLELAEVLRLSRCVVTVDSGPMHLAAAVGARVVALFGPTAANRTGPYGPGHRVVRKVLACSPCFRRRCPDVRCMMEITVDDVVKTVEEVLKEK